MQNDIKNLIHSFLREKTGDQKPPEKPPLVVLLGPTASGKTALSIEIANEFDGEIISADSRQVYRYMDIGTDKIMPALQEKIPHYLLDMVDPDERFTVGAFKLAASEVIKNIHERGKLPLLVGGTGFYIDAVVDDMNMPPEDLELRKKLIEELEEKGPQAMHQKLQKLDPQTASTIAPQNSRYTIRALEIVLVTGRPREPHKNPSPYRTIKIGLNWPREKLFERINSRVDEQLKRGLVDETKKLLAMGYRPELASMSSLGYREVIAVLDGKISLEQAAELLKKNTRNYAKRQMTWFKRDPTINWISGSTCS